MIPNGPVKLTEFSNLVTRCTVDPVGCEWLMVIAASMRGASLTAGMGLLGRC
jgi:hypothetical protein